MTTSSPETNLKRPEDRVIQILESFIGPLGYEVVTVEIILSRAKTLRLFIDFADHDEDKTIGIEDCVKVTKALDEPLEVNTEIDALFKGAYELEVSSPGVDRPLRKETDYERYSGRDVRLHVFRPLTAEEMENAKYQERNPKQKNFVGRLKGIKNGKILLALGASGSTDSKPGKPSKKASKTSHTNSVEEVLIPLPLISKANLEPKFEFGETE